MGPGDIAAGFGFAISRLACQPDERPVVLVTTALWRQERGRPFGRGLQRWGLAEDRLIWIRAEREGEALWALEEALKSGAVAGGLATAAKPSFVATHRLDAAARAGKSVGILLRGIETQDLSAARRRWRITALASQAAAIPSPVAEMAIPGPARLRVELVRSRDGLPNGWELEQDDETGNLSVVAGLADHDMAPPAREERRLA